MLPDVIMHGACDSLEHGAPYETLESQYSLVWADFIDYQPLAVPTMKFVVDLDHLPVQRSYSALAPGASLRGLRR